MRDLGDAKKQARPIHGLAIEGEGHRYYPGRELAGSVLGFVAPDGQGKDGLELALDEELRGKRRGRARPSRPQRAPHLRGRRADEPARSQGYDVTLTIDEGIQHVAERELDAAMRTYETKGGVARRRRPARPARSSRSPARPGTTRTTTPRARPTRAATAR